MRGLGKGKTAALAVPALLALVLAAPGRVRAVDGVLDPFFDGNGTTTIGYAPGDPDEAGYGVAARPSGRVLVGGFTSAPDPAYGRDEMNVFALRRDGGTDRRFGEAGGRRVGTRRSDYGTSLAVQPGGKILVAGIAGPGVFLACRLTAGGDVDPTFGVRGCRRVNVDGVTYAALAVQKNGKVLIAGTTRTATDFDAVVVRLTRDGALDPTFDGDGVATVDFGGDDQAWAVAVQPDGKVLVAGAAVVGSAADFAVARLLPEGSPDPAFSGDGVVTVDFFGDPSDVATALAVQPDGKILVAGYSFVSAFGDDDMAVARLDASGNLDATFASGGRGRYHFGGTRDDSANAVLVLRDGRIIVGGGTEDAGVDDDFALLWLLPSGMIDLSVGSPGGRLITDIEGVHGSDNASALAFQRDGKLLLAGSTAGPGGVDAAVARYRVDLPWNGGFERAYAAAGEADVWRLSGTGAGDGLDCSGGYGGSDCAVRLTAAAPGGPAKRVEQWTGASGKKGDLFIVIAWTEADGADGDGLLQIRITFRYKDGTLGTFRLRPNGGTHGWEESTRAVRARKAYRNMKVTLVYGKAAGSVRFDDVLVAPQQ